METVAFEAEGDLFRVRGWGSTPSASLLEEAALRPVVLGWLRRALARLLRGG